jgi:hypothetical protein
MITGYNTDVEYDGVTYHVQTEDKGLENPIILSLVYAGGKILASKRSPYRDLIKNGIVDAGLVERLQRQHKLICAAIHAGRIEELKQLSQREHAGKVARPTQATPTPAIISPRAAGFSPPVLKRSVPGSPPPRTRLSVSPPDDADALKIKLIDEPALRAGQSVALRVMISKGSGDNQLSQRKARVSVRILGSTFSPVKANATADKNGIAEINITIPEFTKGRGAILLRAEVDKEVAELRRIIQPAKLKK